MCNSNYFSQGSECQDDDNETNNNISSELEDGLMPSPGSSSESPKEARLHQITEIYIFFQLNTLRFFISTRQNNTETTYNANYCKLKDKQISITDCYVEYFHLTCLLTKLTLILTIVIITLLTMLFSPSYSKDQESRNLHSQYSE